MVIVDIYNLLIIIITGIVILKLNFGVLKTLLATSGGLNHFNPKARGFVRSPHEGDTGMTTTSTGTL